jgi:hypothetical protein
VEVSWMKACRWAFLGLVFLGVLASGGCGDRTKLVAAGGVVTLGGKPLDNVQVEFLPDPEQGTKGLRSTGVTDAQGHFTLTYQDARLGAVPGKHRVLITDMKQWEGIRPGRDDANKPLKPSRVPELYTDVTRTPFKVEVKEGGPPLKLELTGR